MCSRRRLPKTREEKAQFFRGQKRKQEQKEGRGRDFSEVKVVLEETRTDSDIVDILKKYETFEDWAPRQMMLGYCPFGDRKRAMELFEAKLLEPDVKKIFLNDQWLIQKFGGVDSIQRQSDNLSQSVKRGMYVNGRDDMERFQQKAEESMAKRRRTRDTSLDVKTEPLKLSINRQDVEGAVQMPNLCGGTSLFTTEVTKLLEQKASDQIEADRDLQTTLAADILAREGKVRNDQEKEREHRQKAVDAIGMIDLDTDIAAKHSVLQRTVATLESNLKNVEDEVAEQKRQYEHLGALAEDLENINKSFKEKKDPFLTACMALRAEVDALQKEWVAKKADIKTCGALADFRQVIKADTTSFAKTNAHLKDCRTSLKAAADFKVSLAKSVKKKAGEVQKAAADAGQVVSVPENPEVVVGKLCENLAAMYPGWKLDWTQFTQQST